VSPPPPLFFFIHFRHVCFPIFISGKTSSREIILISFLFLSSNVFVFDSNYGYRLWKGEDRIVSIMLMVLFCWANIYRTIYTAYIQLYIQHIYNYIYSIYTTIYIQHIHNYIYNIYTTIYTTYIQLYIQHICNYIYNINTAIYTTIYITIYTAYI
jgi:hypothetical protein